MSDNLIGQSIAHYRITAKIGEGGMGEVYRATDTKLGRDVALKILPQAFAADADRMARFEREAKVLASLNHPNIAQIYGVEERALVMELVEGETLQGPLPLDTALNYARQIAEALEAAHEKGIVHRDLKPANIKITPQGVVKVLDFGLAAISQVSAGDASNPANSPTLTISPTIAGMILGTAAYMPPEQARGKPIDRRADIWAFGCVFYEMITGRQLFQGDDVSEILAAVIKDQADLGATPAQVRRLLEACLQKDPKKRLQAIGDWRYLLDARTDDPRQPRTRAARVPWAIAALFAAIAIALGIVQLREPPRKAVFRYTIAAPENTTSVHSFAISPDGHWLAIAALMNGKHQLWLRSLDALQAQPMPATDDATYPFWSPDNRYIGFFAQGKLKKIAVTGGPAQTLCDASDGRGGSWNRDDVIVFSHSNGGMVRVSAAGGDPVSVSEGGGIHRFPVFLPDGRHFLYLLYGLSGQENGIYVSSLDGKENRRILPDVSSVFFASGRVLFIRESTLMAQPFDSAAGKMTGEMYPIAEAIPLVANGLYAPVTVSATGVLLYESGGPAQGINQMAWYDRTGKLLGAVGAPGPVFDPAISPDEKSVVFRRTSSSESDLWVRDLARGTDQRLTTGGFANLAPVWAPQGDRIVFSSDRDGGRYSVYQKAASGTGQEQLLLAGSFKFPSQWSRDGRFIVYREIDTKTKQDIWVLPMDNGVERKPVSFLHSEFNEIFGQLSPDNHWMAYTSDESGQREVYVRPFPTGEGQWKISIAGGEQPRWRGDGKEMFFMAATEKLMAVPVKAMPGTKPSFEPGQPESLFDAHTPETPTNSLFEYDVTADGKRFLVDTVGAIGAAGSAPLLNVVVNWDAGLRK